MSRFQTSDGTHIHFEVRGDGEPPLIFVHGWCSNLRHWDQQVGYFSARHRVLAVDRRGHGLSEVAAGGHTVEQHATDLAELATDAGFGSAIVVGHAGGGPTTLQLAASHPEVVRALVLVDSRIGKGGGKALAALIDEISGPDGDDAFTLIYGGFFSDPAGPLAAAAVADAAAMPRNIAVAELAGLAIDSEAVARRVDQPVLWLSADRADESAIAAVFGDVQFGRFVGSGHFPQLEVPDQTNAMIERFVTSL